MESKGEPPLKPLPITEPPKNSNKKLIFGIFALLVLMVVLLAAIIIKVS